MEFKKIILLITTILCIVGGTMSVFADETTNQTKEELPSETIIANNDTYILDEKINNTNIDERAKLSIGGHTYYKLNTTQNEYNVIIAFLVGTVVVLLSVIFGTIIYHMI